MPCGLRVCGGGAVHGWHSVHVCGCGWGWGVGWGMYGRGGWLPGCRPLLTHELGVFTCGSFVAGCAKGPAFAGGAHTHALCLEGGFGGVCEFWWGSAIPYCGSYKGERYIYLCHEHMGLHAALPCAVVLTSFAHPHARPIVRRHAPWTASLHATITITRWKDGGLRSRPSAMPSRQAKSNTQSPLTGCTPW